MEVNKLSDIQYEIINQIATAVNELGGKSDLVASIMSWGDTLPEEEILSDLRQWNINKKLQHQ